MPDYFFRQGESIFSLCETREREGGPTNNRTTHPMAQSAYKIRGFQFLQWGTESAIVTPDPNSKAQTPSIALTGYKINGTQIGNAAARGARPQCRSTNSTTGAPIVGTEGRLLHQTWTSSFSAFSFNVTRTATAWTFGTSVVNGAFQEVFVEIVGGGGAGSAAGATAVGYRGQGGASGAWALLRVRLDVGQTMTISVGPGGQGTNDASNANAGGETRVSCGNEWVSAGGGNGGVWGGFDATGQEGGKIWGNTMETTHPPWTGSPPMIWPGTYIKVVASAVGDRSVANGGTGNAVSISTNDATPENNSVARSKSGAPAGNQGGAGASSLLGVGGAGGSSGGNGNNGGGYGSGGGGGRRDAGTSRKYGGSGASGWVGFWY